jgi:precorrin-4 methylase
MADIVVPSLTPVEAILYAAVGVFISFLIPVLRKSVITVRNQGKTSLRISEEAKKILKSYLMTAIFSIIAAIIAIAYLYANDSPINGWATALIAGFTFDSFLQKLKG